MVNFLYRCLICSVLLLHIYELFENGIFKGATTLNLTTFSITITNATLSIMALNTVMLSVANKPIVLSVVAPFLCLV
jgi:hypothetical protein